jgi:hypothetical protein
MRLIPRRDEIAELVEVLNGDHKTVGDAAKATLKACADQLQMRDLVALVVEGMNIGPFGNSAEAEAFGKKLAPGTEMRIVSLIGPGPLMAGMDGKKGTKGLCLSCGFAAWAHELSGTTRGKNVMPVRCAGWAQ